MNVLKITTMKNAVRWDSLASGDWACNSPNEDEHEIQCPRIKLDNGGSVSLINGHYQEPGSWGCRPDTVVYVIPKGSVITISVGTRED